MKHQTIIKATMLTVVLAIASSCEKGIEFTYIEEEAIVQDVTTSVTATGTIEPVTSVDVGTQVSGIVSKLYVDYNSVVKAGDVIAEQYNVPCFYKVENDGSGEDIEAIKKVIA